MKGQLTLEALLREGDGAQTKGATLELPTEKSKEKIIRKFQSTGGREYTIDLLSIKKIETTLNSGVTYAHVAGVSTPIPICLTLRRMQALVPHAIVSNPPAG